MPSKPLRVAALRDACDDCAANAINCAQVREAALDIFVDLGPWSSDTRNPCFRDSAGNLRCLPYVSIVGVSKCGTTDIYQKLMLMKCVPWFASS